MSLFTAETNSKVSSVCNCIPSKFWSSPEEVLKVVLLTSLNVQRVCAIIVQKQDFLQKSVYFSWKLLPKPVQNQLKTTCTDDGLR